MTVLPTFVQCLAAAVVAVVVSGLVVVYRLTLHPLAKFPGPITWRATRLPWVRYTTSGYMWRKLEDLHQRHGPIVRIAPNELSICSPQAWPDIYTSRPILPKEPSSQTPPLNGADSLFTAIGDDHRRIRGSLAAGFSDKALREQSPLLEQWASELIGRLRRELTDTSVVDIHKYFGYAALDTITDLSYGGPLDGLAGRNEHSWMDRFFLHGRFSTFRMSLCWFYPLDKILDFIILSLTRRQRAQNWAVFGGKILGRIAKGDMPDRVDLINSVVGKVADGVEHGSKGKGISRNELLSHSLASVIANSQLTTSALTTCIFYLLQHEQARQCLVDEIRNAFTSDEQITVQSTQPLVYLEAVIHETLRVHHPTPILLPRVVPPEGRVIDGTFIPGNTIVGVNLHVIATSPSFWVESHAFRPERFLPPSDERYDAKFNQDVKAAYMPFSTGPRNCIGGKLFLAEARVTLTKLLWNFDVVLADSNVNEWLDQAAYIVCEPKSLQVELIDRRK
ncbi:cytochrome P450 monooxygenase-like protein [Mytilinidion resinicola]|uniref:Cytochrome P450 monooxygenase-like protein n=1 Tax=Mytilinidion resinicola TaxID=574789 RepID=A0A6A6Z6E7_9PEZI|nr:cytochrome P450 monooxygenase-like protein [Mytilinidion resinicola]KAF2816388.1 cytochrome P450 monooxygenase-like protein [Mytilinidion resinicola]